MTIYSGNAQTILIDLICIFLLAFSYIKIKSNKRFNYPYVNCFIVANLCANVCELFAAIYFGWFDPSSDVLLYIFGNGYNCSAIIATACWFLNSLQATNSKIIHDKKKLILILIPIGIQILLTLTTGIHHKIYYYDETLTYIRGDWFLPFFGVSGLYILASLVLYLKAEKNNEIYIFKNLNRFASVYTIFLMLCMLVQALSGGVLSVINVAAAIISLLIHEDLLQKEIKHDSLTGLNNRNAINEYMLRILNRNCEGDYVILFDIDKFKLINDNRGHLEGDYALKIVAKALVSEFTQNAFFGRLGGDEFLIVLENSSRDEAETVEDRLNNRIRDLLEEENKPYTFTVSTGFVEITEQLKTIPDVISVLDERMYTRKKSKQKAPK